MPVDDFEVVPDTSSAVDYKKKNPKRTISLPIAEVKVIRLKPSTSDYATFVRTTSQVLGTTGPASRKTKPSKRLLSLMNLGS